MWYLMLFTVFILLLVSSIFIEKEKENLLWLKIVLIYISFFVSFNIDFIRIPITIIIAYMIIRKKSKFNNRLKYMTLLFSLIFFLLTNYLLPPIPSGSFRDARLLFNDMLNFKTMESYQKFSPESDVQSEIQQYSDKSNGTMMFLAFVLKQKNIPIKDAEWLRYEAHKELDLFWYSTSVKQTTEKIGNNEYASYPTESREYIRFNKTGEEYLGVLKKDKNGQFYVYYVIEGKLKKRPTPTFFSPGF